MELEVYKKSDFYEDYIDSQKEYYERENADAYFAERLAEKDKEIAELKAKLAEKESWVKMLGEGQAALSLELEKTKQKLEDVQASAYAESVDAGMRERRLRRALYKACAMWADRTRLICSVFGSSAPKIRWERMLDKCRAKADEYK